MSEEEVVRSEASKGPSPLLGSHAFPGAPGPGWRRGMGLGTVMPGPVFVYSLEPNVWLRALSLHRGACPLTLTLWHAFPLSFASVDHPSHPVTSRALLGINITHHQP